MRYSFWLVLLLVPAIFSRCGSADTPDSELAENEARFYQMHLQMIRHYPNLQTVTGDEFQNMFFESTKFIHGNVPFRYLDAQMTELGLEHIDELDTISDSLTRRKVVRNMRSMDEKVHRADSWTFYACAVSSSDSAENSRIGFAEVTPKEDNLRQVIGQDTLLMMIFTTNDSAVISFPPVF